ncbi:pyruvate carboxyltransferase [Streptomyces sp. NPDC001982]|uniref:pyruvate carboxyltransferase n=1 Tax=Streptomyces sp. NPDC001982 TaxID=3154405 RepID=UPI00332C3453
MSVSIRDVTPRLLFQAVPAETGVKVELVNRLVDAGLRNVEVSSFVSRDRVPLLADAENVFTGIDRVEGVSYECCVASSEGVRRASDAGVSKAWYLLSLDQEFGRQNAGRGTAADLDRLAEIVELALDLKVNLGTYIIGSFGGPGGIVSTTAFDRFLTQLEQAGAGEWIVADSFGFASPNDVAARLPHVLSRKPQGLVRLQIHDTQGMGLANVAAALRLGVRGFDVSVAGTGGHPMIADTNLGAVCSEDLVNMMRLMGYETGIDLPKLLDIANWLASLDGVDARGFVRRSRCRLSS